jgi:hypothetical protein
LAPARSGQATVLYGVTDAAGPEGSRALRLLCERYPQYRPPGAVVATIVLSPTAWYGWTAA